MDNIKKKVDLMMTFYLMKSIVTTKITEQKDALGVGITSLSPAHALRSKNPTHFWDKAR